MRLLIALTLLALSGCTTRYCDSRGCWDPALSAEDRQAICRQVEEQLQQERVKHESEASQ